MYIKRDMAASHNRLAPLQVAEQHRAGNYEGLIASLTPMIWAMATRKVNLHQWQSDALDLNQEALLAVWSALPSYKPDAALLSTWAYVVAENAMRMWLRTEIRQTQSVQVEGVSAETAFDGERVDKNETAEELLDVMSWHSTCTSEDMDPTRIMDTVLDISSAVAKLPERQQQAIIMRMEGYSAIDIARIMDTSRQAVSKLISKGVVTLRLLSI